jgi:hypothetical protein
VTKQKSCSTVSTNNSQAGKHIEFRPRCSHTWVLAPVLEHKAEFPQFLEQGQSVGLLGPWTGDQLVAKTYRMSDLK